MPTFRRLPRRRTMPRASPLSRQDDDIRRSFGPPYDTHFTAADAASMPDYYRSNTTRRRHTMPADGGRHVNVPSVSCHDIALFRDFLPGASAATLRTADE